MKIKISSWKKEIWEHRHLILLSFGFLLISLLINYFSGMYVSNVPGVVAPDLILDHLPTIDLDFLFLYGSLLLLAIFFIYPLLFRVRDLHKVISQFSLIVFVRSIFMSFTHLALPLTSYTFSLPYIFSFFIFQNDLFFSGHTALPFLGFLLFKNKKIKYFFLASSIIMAATVLLMHVHYTIDVFSAYFITYGTFKIGERFFSKID